MLAKVPDPWAQGDFTLWSTEHTEYSDWSSAYDQTTPIAISPDDEARLKANSLFHQVPSMLTSKADQVKRMEQQAAMRARMSVDPAYAASIRPEDLDPAPAIVREDVSRLLSERLTDTTIWEERTAFGNERTIGQFDFLRPTPVTPAQLQTATGGKPVDVLGGVPVGYADWEYDTDPTRAKYAYIEMHA
jgi:hypothetical protein